MVQGTSALAVCWSHSDMRRCVLFSTVRITVQEYFGKSSTNFWISSRDSRLRRVDIFRSHWSAWSARSRRNKDLEKQKLRRDLSVCITSLALSLPPLSFLLTLAQSKLMERLEMISNVLTAATADVKISEEKQKAASSTNTPERFKYRSL